MWGAPSAGTPVLDSFLSGIADLVKSRDGAKLQDFLQIEPPLSQIYQDMTVELRRTFPHASNDEQIQTKCESLVPSTGSGSSWAAFAIFMRSYLTFLRDVNVENLLETYNLLKGLLNNCVIALSDSQMGVIVLPTVLYLSKVLAKLAIGLDRQPELITHLLREGNDTEGEATERVTLVEKSANVVREAFIKCLTDRTGTPGNQGKPEGKRVGIYLMANLCLKLLFKCGKLRNAEQMFASINAQSPPLDHFPASQRVTYLYYLGRYLFSNNLFYPAQIALQSAYDQCHRQAQNQRRLILTYLIPCNIILGRFPSAALLQRPESQGLGDIFLPLCRIIASGDLFAFRSYLAVDSERGDWFARKGILLQLRNRCEILVWRSMARKVFILAGFHGDQKMQAQRGPPPFLYLHKLEAAVRWLETRAPKLLMSPEGQQESSLLSFPPDKDFARDVGGTEPQIESDFDDFLKPDGYFDEEGHWTDVTGPETLPAAASTEGEVDDSLDPFASLRNPDDPRGGEEAPLMEEVESILSSLLTQDLMRGYLTHKNPRFAIPGARVKGPLPTGFPNVWQTIYAKESEDDHVPGWVRIRQAPPGRGPGGRQQPRPASAMGGRVVNLSNVKAVGTPG
ncbi:hypothetical protein AJ80_02361 [Polytolypa hystricis UAMH7299]|uniref:PCI domain-containing protein n=1 Tax=Polytolypa hystricis (strain UAMH7299) TaxID=1447883 RepID=A0A2B7YR94_POLH7|nr:hypothetical protein AJ80_02361 [Polytolypa hystricis UAMH7299]